MPEVIQNNGKTAVCIQVLADHGLVTMSERDGAYYFVPDWYAIIAMCEEWAAMKKAVHSRKH